MISGLSHITLIVKDLNRTTAFLQNIFDAEEIYSSGDKTFSLSKEKFFLIAGLWICIMEGDSLQERTYNHIAFQIQSEEVDEYIERIKALGVEMKSERPRVEGEGRSIYFYDFDNHLFELHAGTLEERLKRYHE
ncbi:FosX/FosE/FosI family fosfomycin resistance thiol transferase [Listeria monocytogenes]|uniref:FosX/FosE/FosI family fosfomycin resistance thiol transferase n=1 Tax=Listeria monocytogenes TaxID=1639 RepID=A0A6Y5Q374_LISMN|nr:fosfomycin resistance hydrolase FosX [Listeria monocytogenes]MDA20451.1 FosX/FosE/FosI family fosfomycin resistance thiol transferase [Listeria monocytogenes serotype 4a]EAC3359878.1 FosX/FosE/FosI family fosfomycin resistance thiol transferase [Listeria monocytogenes]EAC3360028.1 FosX/FosE/FosI family fosfomycin resistance thiol transferase [Listeria monocytogenes]EAC4812881.1 FosX/FosE/FosI family fosfomycin resistance thiol transferase [Listeria monocytogenes]EAC4813056.1 FosX/FosE/FosI 